MKQISVSVAMATYNGAAFIKPQLESIIQQLPENGQIVISDNGSTDATVDIINSFQHPAIKLLINKTRRGVVHNFENALKACTGEVIFLSDQDDLWKPNKVQVCLEHLQRYDLVVSDCEVIDDANNVLLNSYFSRRKSGPGLLKNLVANTYLGCCMAFNRKVLKAATPFPNKITMHDVWLGFVAELFYKPYFIQQPLVSYRAHSNNVTPTSLANSTFGLASKLAFRWNIVKYLPVLMYRRF